MTPRLTAATLTAGLLLALTACGSAGTPPPPAGTPVPSAPASSPAATSAAPSTPESSAPAETATQLAERITAAVPSAGKVTTITEDNDPNDLIGRPTGYTDAAVIEDESGECPQSESGIGIDCGATIEVWTTPEDAKARADYIQGILKGNSAMGTEYHTLRGTALLRVSGKVKPSVAKEYAAAFTG